MADGSDGHVIVENPTHTEEFDEQTTAADEVNIENSKETEGESLQKEIADVENNEKDSFEETETDSKEKYDYTASLMQSNIYHENEINVDPNVVEQLTTGLMDRFLPPLKKAQTTIAQIKDSQQVLIDTVEQENSKFQDCQALTHLEATMVKAKVYHAKLLKLRKEMTFLHEKSAKLKRRALKLQQQKQKEEMNKAQLKEKEYEREKMLTARVASGTMPAT